MRVPYASKKIPKSWSLQSSGYFSCLLNPESLESRLKKCKKVLSGVKFEAIAFSGNSGAIFGGALSLAMKKPIILVRKEHTIHSTTLVEGYRQIKSYVVVDDFQATGATYNRIVSEIKDRLNEKAKCIGFLSYDTCLFTPKEEE